MCNLAGFIGSTRAAPKLIEMIRRQEGLNGGYYTGIVTMTADGKLHCEKVVGDLSTLLKSTGAADLPGNVGLIHSRTRSGGGQAWAHPFVGSNNNIAYIANGSVGAFHPSPERDIITQQLVEAGYSFSAISDREIGRYPRLPGGGSVHMSDVMCQLIDFNVANGSDPASAMAQAFVSAPSEIVGLMVHSSMPGRIIASRINQPLMIGRHRDGWMLATTALAFDDEAIVGSGLEIDDTPIDGIQVDKECGLGDIKAEWTIPMAPCATALFSADDFRVKPFSFVSEVAFATPLEQARQAVLDVLAGGEPQTITEIAKRVKALWPENLIATAYMTVYETIRALSLDRMITFVTTRVPGVEEGLSAPQTRVVLRP